MRVIRLDKFIAEKEQVNWLVDGLLPDVGWTLFYGQKGIGKTTFAMQLCCAMQSGLPFFDRKTIHANILYFQADSVTTEWREIVKRIVPKGNAGFTGVDVPDKAFGNNRYIDTMAMFIDKLKPGYIVFDSLYNMTNISINTEGILVTINKMKELCGSTPWMLIHHPPHGENRAAGHNSLGANCSNEWALTKTKLIIAKGRIVELKELSIKRGNNGLWELYGAKKPHSNGTSYMDREL
jgi:RecA-family ATPase